LDDRADVVAADAVRELARGDGLDLAAQPSERAAAERAERQAEREMGAAERGRRDGAKRRTTRRSSLPRN